MIIVPVERRTVDVGQRHYRLEVIGVPFYVRRGSRGEASPNGVEALVNIMFDESWEGER